MQDAKIILQVFPEEIAVISLNVEGTRRFLCPIRSKTEGFARAQKMWRRKTPQRVFQRLAHTRLVFFGVPKCPNRAFCVYRELSEVTAGARKILP